MKFQPINPNDGQGDQIAMLTYESPEVREAVRKLLLDYKGTRVALRTLSSRKKKGPIKGIDYNDFYSRNVLVKNLREITGKNILPLDLRQKWIATEKETLGQPPSTFNENFGLVVYLKEAYKNKLKLWQHLREQVKGMVDLDIPFVIEGLSAIVQDDNYENNLRVDLGELSKVYNVPILNLGIGLFDLDDPELQKTGFPSKLEDGLGILNANRDWGIWPVCYSKYGALSAGFNPFNRGELDFLDGRVHVVKNLSTETKQ